MHALGFSGCRCAPLRDDAGAPLTPRGRLGKPQLNARLQARQWSERNEAMTGTHTQNPVYSRLTLALLEDTGWYRANYSLAQPLFWGKGLGCDFAMRSCKDWMESRAARGESPHPFCNKVKRDPLETECTEDRSSVALCNLVEHPDKLPLMYRNFDSIPHVKAGEEAYYGGSVSLADFCPYIQEFTWRSRNVVVRGSHCRFPDNAPQEEKNFALEQYGPDSLCLDHPPRMWEERSCRQVANYTYTCYYPRQEVPIRIMAYGWLHQGALLCPPCEELCQGERCKPASPPPRGVFYPRDELRCAAALAHPPAAAALAAAVALLAALAAHALRLPGAL
ncbi:Leishmanolysin-like peptidase [Gryllus bimaculatus]|nr:Leishmanolysin-like peptidase [Gryllus bimaculatus]